jgi:hypothetical protein
MQVLDFIVVLAEIESATQGFSVPNYTGNIIMLSSFLIEVS